MTAEELKQLRKKLGYTGRAFAKKLGIKQSTYAKYETGKRSITEEQEMRIRQALGFETGRERADLHVHIDYLKLTFFDTTVDVVMKYVLGIDPKFFATEERTKHNYEFWHSCGSIVLMSREDQQQGILLDLTGEGVIQFEEYLNTHDITLLDWLRQVLDSTFYLEHGLYSRVHSTRIDLAIDEMYNEAGQNFDLRKLKDKKKQDLVYSSLHSYKEVQKIKGCEEYGATLMYGARGNDRIFIRLYEKRYELADKLKLPVEDVLAEYGIWNRYELELGKEVNPHVFERFLNGESLADIAIDILLSKLEVYEEIETDTGIERQAFVEWYEIFGQWKKVEISTSVDEISLERSMRWIEKQVVPTLKMILRILGEEWLFNWLRLCMDEVELTTQKEKQILYEEMLIESKQNGTFLYFDKKISEREKRSA